MNLKVSVIIPTYNRAHTIKVALDSVLNQTYSNWECLVIDDGSTDNTEILMSDYIRQDNRIKYLIRPGFKTKGAATCRNIGLDHITGDYIQFLDSDDYIAHNKFESQLKLLENENVSTISTCKYGVLNPSWKNPKIYNGLAFYKTFNTPLNLFKLLAINFSYFPLHVYLIPREIINPAGRWNENLSLNDDGEFFSRIILNSSKIVFCKNTYVIYRTSAGNRITGSLLRDVGIQSYVDSWNLIDENILKKTGIKNHLYVRAAKLNLYKRLKSKSAMVINKYSVFFKDRWTNPQYLTTYIISKLRTKLMVSFRPITEPYDI